MKTKFVTIGVLQPFTKVVLNVAAKGERLSSYLLNRSMLVFSDNNKQGQV
jgi:hypothetical protein